MTYDDQKQEGIEARQRQKDQKALDKDMAMLAAHEFDEWVKGMEDEARGRMRLPKSDNPLVNLLLSIVGASMAPYRAKNKGPDNVRPFESRVTPKSVSDEARPGND